MKPIIAVISIILCLAACHSPARSIRPILYTNDESRIRTMSEAPMIVLVEVEDSKLLGDTQTLELHQKTEPTTFQMPLSLARISARTLLKLRGDLPQTIRFYSWVWTGWGTGSRLFTTQPGSHHILFLRNENGYLHTVGDYPAYDLSVREEWLADLTGEWNQDPHKDIFERYAAIRIRTQLSQKTEIRHNYWAEDMGDLMGLTSRFFIESQLDEQCRKMSNRFGRYAACEATGREFPEHCDAFRRAAEADTKGVEAMSIADSLTRCEQRSH